MVRPVLSFVCLMCLIARVLTCQCCFPVSCCAAYDVSVCLSVCWCFLLCAIIIDAFWFSASDSVHVYSFARSASDWAKRSLRRPSESPKRHPKSFKTSRKGIRKWTQQLTQFGPISGTILVTFGAFFAHLSAVRKSPRQEL